MSSSCTSAGSTTEPRGLLDGTPQTSPSTWIQVRRRYYGADRVQQDDLVLYNPAKMRVERYRFRGAQIGTPYNIDEVPDGARFRRTNHDDVAFVGRVSELVT